MLFKFQYLHTCDVLSLTYYWRWMFYRPWQGSPSGLDLWPLLVMLHQEGCIPHRSQKMNDRLMQSFSGTAINLHSLCRAKGLRLETWKVCTLAHLRPFPLLCYTYTVPPFPSLVSRTVCWVRLWLWPLSYMCVKISAKADPALTAPSVCLSKTDHFCVFSIFFLRSGQGSGRLNGLLRENYYYKT